MYGPSTTPVDPLLLELGAETGRLAFLVLHGLPEWLESDPLHLFAALSLKKSFSAIRQGLSPPMLLVECW